MCEKIRWFVTSSWLDRLDLLQLTCVTTIPGLSYNFQESTGWTQATHAHYNDNRPTDGSITITRVSYKTSALKDNEEERFVFGGSLQIAKFCFKDKLRCYVIIHILLHQSENHNWHHKTKIHKNYILPLVEFNYLKWAKVTQFNILSQLNFIVFNPPNIFKSEVFSIHLCCCFLT